MLLVRLTIRPGTLSASRSLPGALVESRSAYVLVSLLEVDVRPRPATINPRAAPNIIIGSSLVS